MPKFRKKPVIVEAIQWCGWGEDYETIVALSKERKIRHLIDTNQLEIETLEGVMTANEGDWIIKGVKDEVYPCRNDIFEQTYEPVEE